jgi:hypothetical protein
MQSVAGASTTNATSMRHASRPAHVWTCLPKKAKTLGRRSQSGRVTAKASDAAAMPITRALLPYFFASHGAREAPIERHTRKTASMMPNA